MVRGRLERLAAATARRLGAGGDPALLAPVVGWYGAWCAALERFEEAEQVLDAAARQLRSVGALAVGGAIRVAQGATVLHQGRPADALTIFDDAERSWALTPLVAGCLLPMRALAWSWLGRFAEADGALHRAAEVGGQHRIGTGGLSWTVAMWRNVAVGRGLLGRGRADEAARAYLAAASIGERVGLVEPALVPWVAGAVTALLGAGRADEAQSVVDALERRTAADGRAWPALVVAAGRAGIAAAHGDAAGAEDGYRQALALPVVNRLERAEVLVHYGSWLRCQRRPRQARPLLAEALAAAEAAGAAPLAQVARGELTAAGGRRRGERSATGAGLTSQQQRVAELAATGAPVKEVAAALHLSPRTVDSHLANIYRVLGVAGKAELRRRWPELRVALAMEAE